MALIIETGAALADAESYASVEDADTYATKRALTAWTENYDADKEAALRRATDWMEEEYRHRWKGWRKTTFQALSWPRVGVELEDVAAYQTGGRIFGYQAIFATDQVPTEVKNACVELAIRALSRELRPDIDRPKLSAGVGSARVEWDPDAPINRVFAKVEPMLYRYLNPLSGAGMVQIVR